MYIYICIYIYIHNVKSEFIQKDIFYINSYMSVCSKNYLATLTSSQRAKRMMYICIKDQKNVT